MLNWLSGVSNWLVRSDDSAHDVLAAEEFGMPAPDPRLHVEVAHDVLAAEEFVVPAEDPSLSHRHGPVALPDAPTGIEDAHDVLAAEEFAMPSVPLAATDDEASSGRSRKSWAWRAVGAAAVVTAAVVIVRRLRRG